MRKKFLIVIMIIITFSTCSIPTICRAEDDGAWVSNAFQAAYDFLNEGVTVDENSIVYKIYVFVTNIVKAVNKVLLVLLAGLSIVSLSIVGVRYIMFGISSPTAQENAKKQLHTVFIGMMYGFGAFIIWNIAMSIVRIILSAMSQQS